MYITLYCAFYDIVCIYMYMYVYIIFVGLFGNVPLLC